MRHQANVVAIISLAVASCGARAIASSGTKWTTGSELQTTLSEPVDLFWSGTPLRLAVSNLAKARRVAILIDRRVDPDQKLDLSIKGQPLNTALATIAGHCGLGVAQLGNVLYFGPPATADRLGPAATALERAVRQLSQPLKRRLLSLGAMSWRDLATPRELLAQLADQGGLQLGSLDRIPHDLWAAADLPPLTLINRLTLVAAQFDLTFTVTSDGSRLELVPFPEGLHAVSGSAGAPAAKSKSSSEPSSAVEDVRISRLVIQNKPLKPVLRQLAARLDLELRLDEKGIEAAGVSLDRRISVNAANVTIDDLLHQLLTPAGLTFQRRGRVVEIRPVK